MDDLITDLNVEVIQKGHSYSINIVYSDKYSRDRIERFVESYKLILSQIVTADKLSDIDFITESDIELLDTYNQTEHIFEYGDLLDRFNDNLEVSEGSLLVGYEDSSFTHGEGAFIINELAGMLRDNGVVKQDFVGLFVERSEWFLLASMGVLSIGSIYVPIDVTYPDERIQFMLGDASAKIVLVTD